MHDGSRGQLALSLVSWSECWQRFGTTAKSERICCLTWCDVSASHACVGLCPTASAISDVLVGVGIALANMHPHVFASGGALQILWLRAHGRKAPGGRSRGRWPR